MVDVRFATALQMMLSLAYAERSGVETLTSTQLAEGLAANPSLVRKLLVPLVQAGLVRSFLGKNGGVKLGRPATEITLRDIYAAPVGDKKIFSARLDVPHRCLVSLNINVVFDQISTELEDAVLSRMGARTLADVLDALYAAEEKRARPGPRPSARAAARP